MELSKKTTILLSPSLHDRLTRLAAHEGVSLGELIRRACERQYGLVSASERLLAARELAALSLPVGDVRRLKKESVVAPEDLLP